MQYKLWLQYDSIFYKKQFVKENSNMLRDVSQDFQKETILQIAGYLY